MIQNNKVAIFSDLHLGVHMNRTLWHDVAISWAKWFVSELQEKDINTVIFCGDFFHSRSEITVDTLHKAGELLDLFDGINVYMIPGNHDSFYKNNCSVNSINILKGRSNVKIIDKPQAIQLCGKELFFAPWGTNIHEIIPSDIIFGHFEIQTFKMNSFKMCEEGITAKELLSHAPLVISGHFHLREERVYDEGTILYVGCPFELDFSDEQSTKGYYILDLNTGKFEFIPNNVSPKHHRMSLSNLIKVNDFIEYAKTNINNNFFRLVVDKKISTKDLEKLTTKLGAYSPLNVELDQTYNFNVFSNSDDVDLSGIDIPKAIEEFVNLLDIQNKKDVSDYTISLYNNCK